MPTFASPAPQPQFAAAPAAVQAGVADGTGAAQPSFADLGVSPQLCALLSRGGFSNAFPIQAMVIPDALQGVPICGCGCVRVCGWVCGWVSGGMCENVHRR